MFDVANMLKKKITVKDVPMNNYELLNIQVCSFIICFGTGAALGLHIVTRSDPVSIVPDTDPGYRNDTLKTIL